jgi:hypothetical protein
MRVEEVGVQWRCACGCTRECRYIMVGAEGRRRLENNGQVKQNAPDSGDALWSEQEVGTPERRIAV